MKHPLIPNDLSVNLHLHAAIGPLHVGYRRMARSEKTSDKSVKSPQRNDNPTEIPSGKLT